MEADGAHSFDAFVRARTAALSRVAYLLTGDQTAEVLGIRVGIVKSQAHDGLARLRALLPSPEAAHD